MWWSFCSFVKNKRIKADQIIISVNSFLFNKISTYANDTYKFETFTQLGFIFKIKPLVTNIIPHIHLDQLHSHSLGSYLTHTCSYLIPYHTNTSGSLPTYTWIILINIYGLYHTPQDHTSHLLGSHLTYTCSYLTYTLVHTSHTHVHTSLTLESYLTQLETYSNIYQIHTSIKREWSEMAHIAYSATVALYGSYLALYGSYLMCQN